MAIPSRPPTADELARHVLTRRLGVKRDENVLIESYPSALPWATAFVRQARRLNARPVLLYEDERSYWDAVDHGYGGIIGHPGAHEWAALGSTDVYVYFWGPEDLGRRSRLPDPVSERTVAYGQEWYDRARAAGVRGARMEIAKVTEPNARHYGLSLVRWRAAVLRATMRDPQTLARPIARLQKALRGGRELRLTAPGGTDLRLALDHGPVRTFDGRRVRPAPKRWRYSLMATVPSAAVGVRLNGSVADGSIVANRPSYLDVGPAEGGRARFSGGRMTSLSFRTKNAAVRARYAKGSKGRDQVGFLEIGLDPDLQGVPDLEDCEAGAVTLGIGANAGWGGPNRSSFMTWLVVGGAKLSVDGSPIVRGGRTV